MTTTVISKYDVDLKGLMNNYFLRWESDVEASDKNIYNLPKELKHLPKDLVP
jgi:hypothetical protein